jgi:hypothetical protein
VARGGGEGGAEWARGRVRVGAHPLSPLADCLVDAQYHGVGQAIRWSTGTNHPHLNKITMMAFVFGQVSGNTYDIAAYAGGTQTGFSSG